MFTGLVEKLAKVTSVEERKGQKKITIKTGHEDLAMGESISINGVCLTVAEIKGSDAVFFVSEESLDRSNLGKLEENTMVNLERSLQIGDRMGGHWVQGHVDVKGLVLHVIDERDHHKLIVALDTKFGRYCVEKGSITLNGVSLTINSLAPTKLNEFMISCLIIPHTWKNTNLQYLKSNDHVNVEVDVLAKYIEKLCPASFAQLNA